MIITSVTIGTSADCDICVHDDKYASARHARIDQHDNGLFTIEDLGSTNGTWIRRQGARSPVKIPLGGRDVLRPGDMVCVGRTEIPWTTPKVPS